MQIGIGQVDLAILLPVCAAAWNLTGGQTLFAPRKDSGRVYLSSDGLFAVETPDGWEPREQEGSSEVTFLRGKAVVSVGAAEDESGDTVEEILEFNKSVVRRLCPAAEIWTEGKAAVAGAPGAYFSMLCPGPQAGTIVRVSAALIRERFLIFKVAAPCAELYAAQAAIDRIARSLRDGWPTLDPQ
ncbi:MAG: hypothetical protein ABSD44_14320 [Terracidiphilus sp.]